MFEARLQQTNLLKKVVDAIKELVTEANIEISSSGMSMQAMDSSHIALVSLELRREGFEEFRCDRNMTLGLNLANVAKVLKCASNDDTVELKAADNADTMTFSFNSSKGDRTSEFTLKLMDISSESLGIPETEHEASVKMPSAEFQRICRDLATIGDTVEVQVSKQGIRFSTSGDIGSASVQCKQNTAVDKQEEATVVHLQEEVTLTFAMRYFINFIKASGLSPQVGISMSKMQPVVVEYRIEDLGYIRYFLAPKVDDEDEMEDVG